MAKSRFSMAQFLWFSDFPLVKESVLLSCSVANDPQNVCHNSWSIIFRFSLTTHTHSCECVCVVHCSCWWLPRWLFHLRCMCPCVDSSRTQCTFTYWTFACTAYKHTYAHMHSTAACAVMWQLHSNCNICCCCCTASAVPAVAGSCTTMDSKSSSCNCNWQCNLAVGQQHVPQAMQFLCSQLPKRRTTHTETYTYTHTAGCLTIGPVILEAATTLWRSMLVMATGIDYAPKAIYGLWWCKKEKPH